MLVRSYSEKESQLKLRTKSPSNKDILFQKVQQSYEKNTTQEVFKKELKLLGITTYNRNGKLCGVYYGKSKFRLKRSLGIDPDLLLLKDKFKERSSSLSKLRKQQEQNKSKGRER